MKISHNWLKWYVPDAPEASKLADILNDHLCEVETIEELPGGDKILDLKILPNRAHDLLSHQGVAREVASLLDIPYVDPTATFKIPESQPTDLKISIESDTCRRYMGRVVRNFKVGPSPLWVVEHLEAMGQRSINNIVDATNIVMYDCGQPTHVFDADKVAGNELFIAAAKESENLTLLGGKAVVLDPSVLTIRDSEAALDVAGIKGGTKAEVDNNTTNLNLSIANFEPVAIRKTAQKLNIFTDAKKRFENDLSPELTAYAMTELSALIMEMCPDAIFEDIIDIYPNKQEERSVSFTSEYVTKMLGVKVPDGEIEKILKNYNYEFSSEDGVWEITVPTLRLDITGPHDMTEEIGRIYGYDKLVPVVPKLDFVPKENETYKKIVAARNSLVRDGYKEVMTYAFADKGEVEVMASASDKKFLRTNLTDGLKKAYELNKLNAPLLDLKEVKIFEIGTVFKENKEEIHVAFANKKEIKEMSLEEFNSPLEEYPKGEVDGPSTPALRATPQEGNTFKMWSLYPFITRDIAVWVPEGVPPEKLKEIYQDMGTELLIGEPQFFDSFTKDGRTSYAHRLVFQSYEKTLTDDEVNTIMANITDKIKALGWQVR